MHRQDVQFTEFTASVPLGNEICHALYNVKVSTEF